MFNNKPIFLQCRHNPSPSAINLFRPRRRAANAAAVTGIPEYPASNKHWFAYICGRLIVNDEKERVSFQPTSYFRPQTSRPPLTREREEHSARQKVCLPRLLFGSYATKRCGTVSFRSRLQLNDKFVQKS